jgi:hypothetical protein
VVAVRLCSEGEANLEAGGIKEHTISIYICSCPDYMFLNPREICGNLDDTLFVAEMEVPLITSELRLNVIPLVALPVVVDCQPHDAPPARR